MYTLNCKGRLLVVDKPIVMGILNTNNDSFYAGSRVPGTDASLFQAENMLAEGAAILDVGAQSTRPGSERISAGEELKRAIPVIEAIHKRFPEAILSIDTYYSTVAAEAVMAGASMVNDVSAGSMDDSMLGTVGKLNTPFVCMHMKGTPESMHMDPQYENVSREVLDFFIHKTEECRMAGIHDIIIDPGFGFGKTIAHNFQLLKELPLFSMLQRPLLVGLSRKSTIYRTLGITPDEALNGTTVLNCLALQNGASVLRVHDVKEAVETIRLMQAYWR